MIKKSEVTSIEQLGEAVQKRRKKLQLRQMEAAGLVGVGVRFLSELERGKESLEIGKVLQVLQGLGLKLNLESPDEAES